MPAQPLAAAQTAQIKGKAVMTLQQFLLMAPQTTLAPGVTWWTWASRGDPFSVTATITK